MTDNLRKLAGRIAAQEPKMNQQSAPQQAEPQAQAEEPKIEGYKHEVETFDADGYACYKTIVTSHPKPLWHGVAEVTKINETEPLITLQSHREAMAEADGVRHKAVIELSEHLIGANQLMLEQRDIITKKDESIAKKDAALKACVEAFKILGADDFGIYEVPEVSTAIAKADEARK